MTRKDFQLVADALKAAKGLGTEVPFGELCQVMADFLSTTNERFDRRRFLTACGIEAVA